MLRRALWTVICAASTLAPNLSLELVTVDGSAGGLLDFTQYTSAAMVQLRPKDNPRAIMALLRLSRADLTWVSSSSSAIPVPRCNGQRAWEAALGGGIDRKRLVRMLYAFGPNGNAAAVWEVHDGDRPAIVVHDDCRLLPFEE